jgi:hypothetical protein
MRERTGTRIYESPRVSLPKGLPSHPNAPHPSQGRRSPVGGPYFWDPPRSEGSMSGPALDHCLGLATLRFRRLCAAVTAGDE